MEHSLFARLGRFAVRRRWFVIPAWVAILVVMGSFAKGLTGRLSSGGFEVPNSESLSVLHDLQSTFSAQFPSTALVVVTTSGTVLTEAGRGVPAGYEVLTGGAPAFFSRFNEISRQDLDKAEKVSF